jgi:hypothetical protein
MAYETTLKVARALMETRDALKKAMSDDPNPEYRRTAQVHVDAINERLNRLVKSPRVLDASIISAVEQATVSTQSACEIRDFAGVLRGSETLLEALPGEPDYDSPDLPQP